MTVQEAAIVRNHMSGLDRELRSIVGQAPPHLSKADLDGWLHWTLAGHIKELRHRLRLAVEREEFELAVAVQRVLRSRLEQYL